MTCANSLRMLVSRPVLRMALFADGARPLLESARMMTKRSPIAAITECAASQAVVTAPTMTRRPVHVSVSPPSLPTLRSFQFAYDKISQPEPALGTILVSSFLLGGIGPLDGEDRCVGRQRGAAPQPLLLLRARDGGARPLHHRSVMRLLEPSLSGATKGGASFREDFGVAQPQADVTMPDSATLQAPPL